MVIPVVVEGTRTTVLPHPLQVRIDQYYVLLQYVCSHVHSNFSRNLSALPVFFNTYYHTLRIVFSSTSIVGQLAQLFGAVVRIFEWIYEPSLSQFQPGMLCILLRFICDLCGVLQSFPSLNIWKYQTDELLWIFPILCCSNPYILCAPFFH